MANTYFTGLGRGWRRLTLGIWLALAVSGGAGVTWEPIPADERAAQPPPANPDAVAELLYWRIDLTVKNYKATQRNLQRVKIYSERAIEELGRLGVDYTDSEKVSGLVARVVRTDGSATELPADQFREMVLGRTNQMRRMARRLVVPHLRPGDIVELQWRTDEDGRFRGSRFIYCQQTIPVRKFEFFLHNAQSDLMSLATFGAGEAKLDGFGTTRGHLVIKDIPAYVEEPDMPPAFNVRASVLVVYGRAPEFENDAWGIVAEFLKALEQLQCAVTKEIMTEADKVCAGKDYREDRLRALYEYCQEKIANTAFDESPESLAERVDYHETRTAQAVLKNRRGNALEINCLFAALARAAGFEVHLTFSAERTEILSVRFPQGSYFMKTSGVLVKVGGEWKLFAPGERAVAFGYSRWQREDTETFHIEDNFIHWENIVTEYKQQARQMRQAKAVIGEDGSLEADVTERLEGQEGIAWREEHWNAPTPTWERLVRDRVQAGLPEAEISAATIDHLMDTAEPLVIRYHLRLPNYAAASGDRRLIVPDFLQMHAEPRYAPGERKNRIWWKYPRQEIDELNLTLPPGYELEAPNAPAPVQDARSLLVQRIEMSLEQEANCVHYRRETTVGRPGGLAFEATAYETMRRLFESIQAGQTHVLVLSPKSP